MAKDLLLEETTIFADARALTGRDALFEHDLGDRLQRLLRHLDEDLALDLHGRQSARETVSDLLARRANFFADRIVYPEIDREKIERPLIVTGLPRSGTTLLHSLLAVDPYNRAPRWWEAVRPSPPPGISPADDPRIARADAEIAELLRLQPALLQAHPYMDEGGTTLIQCEQLCALDFRYIFRSLYYRVPGIVSVSLESDMVKFYEFHKMVLQALQWRRPPRRWALKGVEHHAHLQALKTVYPDAIVIWIHRDPLKVFPSVLELLVGLYEGLLGRSLDRPALARQILRKYEADLEAAMEDRFVSHQDMSHLLYADLIKNPLESVEGIYRRHGVPFDEAVTRGIMGWLASPRNKGDRHGRFRYTLDSFGITPAYIEDITQRYRRRFGIPYEARA